jgi:hypothetical protein
MLRTEFNADYPCWNPSQERPKLHKFEWQWQRQRLSAVEHTLDHSVLYCYLKPLRSPSGKRPALLNSSKVAFSDVPNGRLSSL